LLGELSTNFTKVQISICNNGDFWNGHPFSRCAGSIQYGMEAVSTRVWFNGTLLLLIHVDIFLCCYYSNQLI